MAASTQPGWILAAARSDQRATVWLALIFLFLSGGFLAWNAEVIYNIWSGPFDFTADVAAGPGRRQWVSSGGAMMATGLEQQSTLRLFKGAVSSTNVTAKYLAQPKLGKILIVKVGNDFSGDPVVGELVPLPAAILAELTSLGPKDRFHPYLLDATRVYFTFWSIYGLLLLFAGLVALLSVVLLAYGLANLAPEKHDEFVALAKLGPAPTLAARIESDLARAGSSGTAGPFRLSPSWLVLAEPLLRIIRAEDLVAFSPFAEAKVEGKQNTASIGINLFRKGQATPLRVDISATDLPPVLAALRARYPWAWEENHAAILGRWASERGACEKESAARRVQAPRAGSPNAATPTSS